MLDNTHSDNGNKPPTLNYPFTNVQIAPDGIMVTVIYSSSINMNIALDARTCEQIVNLWIQQKKQNKNMLDMAHRIQKEKLA